MKKYALTSFVMFATITTSYSMITESNLSFKPYIQVLNPKVQKQRDKDLYTNEITQIGNISENNDYFRCFQYALQETTGFKGNINFYKSKHVDIPINQFFQQIPHPKPGCLVVYTDDSLRVNHFAVAVDSMNFKSKFGENSAILLHTLFRCPSVYRNNAYFFELLPEYEKNRDQLHQDLAIAATKTKSQAVIHKRIFFGSFCIASGLVGILIGKLVEKSINYARS